MHMKPQFSMHERIFARICDLGARTRVPTATPTRPYSVLSCKLVTGKHLKLFEEDGCDRRGGAAGAPSGGGRDPGGVFPMPPPAANCYVAGGPGMIGRSGMRSRHDVRRRANFRKR